MPAPQIAFVLQSPTQYGQATSVEAVDLVTGKVLWQESIVNLLLHTTWLPEWSSELFADAIAFAPGGDLYVVAGIPGATSLLVLRPADGALLHRVALPSLAPTPQGLAVSPDGRTAYVTQSGDTSIGSRPAGSTVTPVDLTTDRVGKAVPVGTGPVSVAFSPDGTTAYVTATNDTVTPIDVQTGTAGRPVSLDDHPVPGFGFMMAGDIAVSPTGEYALVGSHEHDLLMPDAVLEVVDLATGRAETPIRLIGGGQSTAFGGSQGAASQAIVFSCDGSDVYDATSNGLQHVQPAASAAATEVRSWNGDLLVGALVAREQGRPEMWVAVPEAATSCSYGVAPNVPPCVSETAFASLDAPANVTGRPVGVIDGEVTALVIGS